MGSNKLKSVLIGLIISNNVFASGVGATTVSFFSFLFFGIIAWAFGAVIKFRTKNMKESVIKKLFLMTPKCLLISPAFYNGGGGAVLLPSGVVLPLSIQEGSKILFFSSLISICLTFLFFYFIKLPKYKDIGKMD